MPFGQFSEGGGSALRRAADLAHRSGAVTPAHLLAAVLEVSGPLREVATWAHAPLLQPAGKGQSHDEVPVHYDMLAHQAIDSAAAWAARRGAKATPEDLLIVLMDQHSPSVVAALARMGPESERLRRAALLTLGLPEGYGPVTLEPLKPMAAHDRPPLGLDELPAGVWAEAEQRHGRLPLRRIRRLSDWQAVAINEQRAALKIAAGMSLSPDETYSLLHHHMRAVERLAARAAPSIVTRSAETTGKGDGHGSGHRPGIIPVSRAAWTADRRLALKVAWFRWTSQRY